MAMEFILVVALIISATLFAKSAAQSQSLPGCPDRCGNLTIPYPFGMADNCYYSPEFFIKCDTSSDPPKPLTGNLTVTNITIAGELQIMQFSAKDCINPVSGQRYGNNLSWINAGSFTISNAKNKFIAVGCDSLAVVVGYQNNTSYTTGCVSLCDNSTRFAAETGSCVGVGCCQMELPDGLMNVTVGVSTVYEHSKTKEFNPCSFATLVEQSWFEYSPEYLSEFPEMVPLVLDWGLGNETCEKGKCLCSGNSTTYPSPRNQSEYLCSCLPGFDGNPYLPEGCQDVDECQDGIFKCPENSECMNTVGNYTCSCRHGYHMVGENCVRIQKVIQYTVGISIGVLSLLIISSWSYLGYRRWKFIKLKEKFFQKNGGIMLQQELSTREGSTDTAKIFTQEQLEKATDNYDESRIIGSGGYGTVYKGILADGLIVAIKKSKIIDQSQIEQFVNEVLVLSQINHRNVVRLLGCCLETEVPLLVYEFVNNGTLSDHIHDKTKASALLWEDRLRIATEAAGVLWYLHSAASVPIVHRDVKSTNILLDNKNTAKVSDFGASRLVPLDQTQLSTMVQGTLGYLDPEYFQTGQLTDKSDVYSFGVVLVELITGKQVISFDRPEELRNLAMYFLTAMKEDRVVQIVEDCLVSSAKIEHLKEVAILAKRCLRVKGEERPSMKEVAMELEGLRVTVNHPCVGDESYSEETEYLISVKVDDAGSSTGYNNSMIDQLIFPARDGR